MLHVDHRIVVEVVVAQPVELVYTWNFVAEAPVVGAEEVLVVVEVPAVGEMDVVVDVFVVSDPGCSFGNTVVWLLLDHS